MKSLGNKLGAFVVATLMSWCACAERVVTPDGFNLTKLYEHFNVKSAAQDSRQIMFEDFEVAISKGNSPVRLFAYAKKGNLIACNLVGYLFDAGKGVRQSSQKAAKWFAYCASKNPLAAYNLGCLYAEGRGVKKDLAKAASYFRIAWEQMRQPRAAIQLAFWYRSTRNWAKEWDILIQLQQDRQYVRYWGYLMGEMIIEKVAPSYDLPKANEVLYLAVEQYSVQGAELLAYSLGVGLDGMPDQLGACQFEILATKFSATSKTEYRWQVGMEQEEIDTCRSQADAWLKLHKKPEELNFANLIY